MEWFAAPGYDLARWLLVRGIALTYVLAFSNVLFEWRALLGSDGLLPVDDFLARVGFRRAPSVFHWRYDDRLAVAGAWVGVLLAAAQLLGLSAVAPTWASALVWAVLFVLYLSYVNVGQIWYGFGWESILLEAGFVAIFLGAHDVAPPLLGILLARWLLFRVELGAGLIKLRGDPVWRDLTALEYHHETQPLPAPLSRRFHLLPRWMHRVETGANHVVQLLVPFGLFLPQPVAGAAAVAIIVTQGWLMVSGNFAWLNFVTIVLATSALPDAWFEGLLPWLADDPAGAGPLPWVALVVAVTVVTVVLSWWPVRNMASRHQRMNVSFNPLHLVGSYGAFGSITRTRYEVVVEGTDDPDPGPDSEWREYEFLAKPGDPTRRPPQVAPFHLRLDWLLWFAAMSPAPDRHRWFLRLVQALLAGDAKLDRLLRHDPFPDEPPTAVRARRFRYRFADDAEHRRTGRVWVREPVGTYLSPRLRRADAPRRR